MIELGGGFAQPELQRQESAGHLARDCDPATGYFVFSQRPLSHQHWPVSVSHAGPGWQQSVLLADISVSVDADGRNIQFTARGTLVEGLDVLENVLKLIALTGDQVLRQ